MMEEEKKIIIILLAEIYFKSTKYTELLANAIELMAHTSYEDAVKYVIKQEIE